uniref:NADH-ubiquinone oxidoreductase chain 5 n=1 Tax=Pontoscolex corethrurus TaxID=195581 RepID=A0A1W5LJT5_9ANNE|nr:NADH dehydrogenase subunit 5 [Pontoscolex corethrurus]ANJ60059.1 NADH dehydrogenase subunit 5 [Pontoscolex corethrurus]
MFQKKQIYSTTSNMLWALMGMMTILALNTLLLNSKYIIEWNLFTISSTPINLSLIADPTSILFSCAVLMISANVMQFSSSYMKDDKFINRFSILVILFILSMNMLIFIPNLIILLLGWDGLGIVSFILVIYYQNSKSLAAGMITALTNRIGDVMLLLAIAWSINQGHWNITHMWENPMNNFQIITILIAGMTKSAQMPFSSWLPAAMAAPTPVSALVHSSTLVTAGVFLLIRFFPFLDQSDLFRPILLFIATSTTLMAGLSACTECDMKKIIALSTLSQLGMMMGAMGLGMLHLAYYHMMTHALFKAMLFICAGNLIHLHIHSQDLRWMGNTKTKIPVTSSCMLLANLALSGFPFMAGFYSKDLIMESSMFTPQNAVMVTLIFLSAGVTAAYSTRFMLFTTWGPNNSPPMILMKESVPMYMPAMILSIMSILAGSMVMWIQPMKLEFSLLQNSMKVMPAYTMLAGFTMAWMTPKLIPNYAPKSSQSLLNHSASCLMWFMTPLSSQPLMALPMYSSQKFLAVVDQSWFEAITGQGAHKASVTTSNSILLMQTSAPMNFLITSSLILLVSLTTTL